MTEGIYDQKLEFEYESTTNKMEIITNSEVARILLRGENGNEPRKIRIHSKVPKQIRLIQFRAPDFFIDDSLKLYRCLRDYNRPYEVNLSNLSFGFTSGLMDAAATPYIFKMVICGECSKEKLTQAECADSIIICPECGTVFDI